MATELSRDLLCQRRSLTLTHCQHLNKAEDTFGPSVLQSCRTVARPTWLVPSAPGSTSACLAAANSWIFHARRNSLPTVQMLLTVVCSESQPRRSTIDLDSSLLTELQEGGMALASL